MDTRSILGCLFGLPRHSKAVTKQIKGSATPKKQTKPMKASAKAGAVFVRLTCAASHAASANSFENPGKAHVALVKSLEAELCFRASFQRVVLLYMVQALATERKRSQHVFPLISRVM